MKKAVGMLLILVLIMSLLSTAMAANMTSSVEQKGKTIAADSATTKNGSLEVVTTNSQDPTWPEEIVITPVSVLNGAKSDIGGNLSEGRDWVWAILEAAYNALNSSSLYQLTSDKRFDRNDLTVCDLFDVSYAEREGNTQEYVMKGYIHDPVTIRFTGISDTIIAVLHGTNDGTAWVPMRFFQNGTNVTVYDFKDFSPVAFVKAKPGYVVNPIQPDSGTGGSVGGGGSGSETVPTSPQTGAWPTGCIACGLATLGMSGCLYVRSRKGKRA